MISSYTANRARELRLRAQEIRITSEALQSAESRQILLEVAEDYERLAHSLEKLGTTAGERDTPAV